MLEVIYPYGWLFGKNIFEPLKTLFQTEKVFFLTVLPNGDHNLIKERNRSSDNLYMTRRNRIK